jgi:hypothetical protein
MRRLYRRRATGKPTAVFYFRIGSAHRDDITSATGRQPVRIPERSATARHTIAGAYTRAARPGGVV